MKFKKFMSLALALIMATALCVPALASSAYSSGHYASSSTTQSSDLEGVTEVGQVDLTVSGVTKVVFNPSKISVYIDTSGDIDSNPEDDAVATNDQVLAPAIRIENKTNVPMKMTATVGINIKGVENKKATVANGAISDTEKAKKIMLAADFAVSDSNADEEDEVQDHQWLTASKLIATAATRAADGTISNTAKSHTDAQAIMIPASEKSGDNLTPNYVFVKFSGAATKAPTDPWTSADGFDVITAYKFQPQTNVDKYVMVASKADKTSNITGAGAPSLYATYSSGAMTVTLGTTAGNKMKDENGDYITASQILPGYTVMVMPSADVNSSGVKTGKYYAITKVEFLDETGNATTTVKANKVGSKKDAYYTFTMPEANVQAVVTYDTSAS